MTASMIRTIYLLVVMEIGFFGVSANASEFSVLLNGKAIHLEDAPAGKKFNEKNWGAGFQYDYEPIDNGRWIPFVTAAGFNDSNKNPSYYAGGGLLRRYQPDGWPVHFDVGMIVFLMKREESGKSVFPGLLPAFSLGTPLVAVNMTFIPKIGPKTVPLLFFQLKITLHD